MAGQSLQNQSQFPRKQEANMRQLCKGNVGVIKGAVLAGCGAYYGYPITPANEIAEAAARAGSHDHDTAWLVLIPLRNRAFPVSRDLNHINR